MNRKEYQELLQDERWKRVSNRIRNRDNHTCQTCGAKNVILHVHHQRYYQGKKPWEIEDEYLITLCHPCHENEHKERSLSSFVYIKKKSKKPKKKKRIRIQNKPYQEPPISKRVLKQNELKQKIEDHKRYLESLVNNNVDTKTIKDEYDKILNSKKKLTNKQIDDRNRRIRNLKKSLKINPI
jgi:ribosomal protein S27AE